MYKGRANSCKRCDVGYCKSTDAAGTKCLVFARPLIDLAKLVEANQTTPGVAEFTKLCRRYVALTGATTIKGVSGTTMKDALDKSADKRDQLALVANDMLEIDGDSRLVIAATASVDTHEGSLDAVTELSEFEAWLARDDGEVCAVFEEGSNGCSSRVGDLGLTSGDSGHEPGSCPGRIDEVTAPDELNAWLDGCGVYTAAVQLPNCASVAPITAVPTPDSTLPPFEASIPNSKFGEGSVRIHPLMAPCPAPCAECANGCGYSAAASCVCYLKSLDPAPLPYCGDNGASADEDAMPSGGDTNIVVEQDRQSVCALEGGDVYALGEILPHVAKQLAEAAEELEATDCHDAVAMASEYPGLAATPLSAADSTQPPGVTRYFLTLLRVRLSFSL